MTNKLKWRLGKLPTSEEVVELMKHKLITNEEARQILFSTTDERDSDSFKEEIKFLKDVISKLSNRSTIIETIKIVNDPYRAGQPWYSPYYTYCTVGDNTYVATSGTNTLTSMGTTTNALYTVSTGANIGSSYVDNGDSFKEIQSL